MFKDRFNAGELLSEGLVKFKLDNPYLLAIPRGGIIIALPIAKKLYSSIHVLVTRKIGHPFNPEVAVGALMPDGTAILDNQLIEGLGLNRNELERIIATEYQEVQRRQILYTHSSHKIHVKGKNVIVIDDGIATGYTIRAAIKWLKQEQAGKIVLAIPVAPPDVVLELSKDVDEIIALIQPDNFLAVGMYYKEFPQTTDQEVTDILDSLKNIEAPRT